MRPNRYRNNSTAAPTAISRQVISSASVTFFESEKYTGRMAAQTMTTHATATSSVSARCDCADISAATASRPTARTKSAGVKIAKAFDAGCSALASAAQRNVPYAIQPDAHTSKQRSRNTRKKSRLAATTIRAAVSRAVNQGTVSAPTDFPNSSAALIDKGTKTDARTPKLCRYHARESSLTDFRVQLVTFGT